MEDLHLHLILLVSRFWSRNETRKKMDRPFEDSASSKMRPSRLQFMYEIGCVFEIE